MIDDPYNRLRSDEVARQRARAEREELARPGNVYALFDAGATVAEVEELTGLRPTELRHLLMLREAQALPTAQRIQVERIEEMLASILPARKPAHVAQAIKLMRREADLLGLDAPRRSEVDMTTTRREETNLDEYTVEELRDFVQRRREIDITPKKLPGGNA